MIPFLYSGPTTQYNREEKVNPFRFNICFIKQDRNILLLNREKPSWMGAWNGVGGKLEPGESPRDSVMREVQEETGLLLDRVVFKGLVTWGMNQNNYGGMYLYLADLDAHFPYPTPVKTDEGILDWKDIDWILHPKNVGVATNIPKFLPIVLQDEACYEHRCTFQDGMLIGFESIKVSSDRENLLTLECS